MKHLKRWAALLVGAALLAACLAGCGAGTNNKLLDPENPTTVTVWNYYNGDQLSSFEALVNEFNDTVGQDEGIVVVSVSQGSIDNLASALLDSVSGKVGAADVPSLAAIYSETAYILNAEEAIVPLDDYFTADQLAEYVPAFLNEGRLTENGPLMLFPVSKSTEVFVANATDWAEFEAACGISVDSIETSEDLTAAAKAYYEWTDSLTPDVAGDGKALYGRDSVANYIVIGAKQLGHPLFSVNKDGGVVMDFDKDTLKTIWKNYYVPFVNGWFGAYAKYRSEDLKTGAVLAITGSSSGVSYIPTEVTEADDTTHSIDVSIRKALTFENADAVSVQQGAGYCVMKTDEAQQYAAAEFLKWFTDADRNLTFSLGSGYSPVKLAANDVEKIKTAYTADSPKTQNMLAALLISAEVYTTEETYTSPAFDGSKDIRDILGDALDVTCAEDRAAVAAKIEAGVPHDEAVAPYVTDAAFESWYQSLCNKITAAIPAK